MKSVATNHKGDFAHRGSIEIRVGMKADAPLDLAALKKAGSIRTRMKRIEITDAVFRMWGTITRTGTGHVLVCDRITVELVLTEKLRDRVDRWMPEGKPYARVTGHPTRKSRPDPKDPKKRVSYLEVVVTAVDRKEK